jgi:hypothetical protein
LCRGNNARWQQSNQNDKAADTFVFGGHKE